MEFLLNFFYKFLIPSDDENSINNSASGLDCLQKIFSRIWNGKFPSTWNDASIMHIPKKKKKKKKKEMIYLIVTIIEVSLWLTMVKTHFENSLKRNFGIWT